MNFDMINDWLNDFSNWGKIFGGLAKVIGNEGILSTAWEFLEGGNLSAHLDLLSDNLSGDFSS